MAGCAALSLGGGLVAPARAQSVIAVSQSAAVNLAGYGAGPVSVTSGAALASGGWAVLEDTQGPVTLNNAGSVDAASGIGIYLSAGGAVDNQATGAIRAATYGVLARGAAISVSNAGVIAGGDDGVSLNAGGNAANAAAGSIFGAHIGVYTGNGLGVIANSGVISARTGDAVSLYAGGSLDNTASGQLLGGYSGAFAGGRGATVQNAGLISGPVFGVYLAGPDSLSNGGTIAGGTAGIIAVAPGAAVTNTGLVHGVTAGVRLGRGDMLANSGSISGATGVLVKGAGASVYDTGLIAGAGGAAVQFEGGASSLTLGTGAGITGAIDGGGTDSAITLTGSGQLTSDLANFGAGGVLNVAAGADWTAAGNWAMSTVKNAGTFQPGTIGAALNITGNFVQLSSGTLRVVVSPTGVSQVNISGTALLGGRLVYVLAPGNYTPAAGAFLTANGGLSGSFASVSTQLAPGEAVVSGNATVLAIDPPGVFSYRLGAFSVAPADDALFTRARQAMALDAGRASDELLDQAQDAPAAVCPRAGTLPGGRGAQAGIAEVLAGAFCGAGGWVAASGNAMNQPGSYNAQSAGFLAGVGRAVNDAGTTLGLAVGYDATALSDAQGGTASAQTIRLGVYGVQNLGRFVLSGDVLGGFISTSMARATGVGAASARPGGSVVSGGVRLAMPLRRAGFGLLPSAGVSVAQVSLGRFSETAQQSAFVLSAPGASGNSVRPYLRLAVSRDYAGAARVVWTPQLGLGVDYEAGDPGRAMQVIAADGSTYAAGVKRLAPLAGEVMAGVSAGRGNMSLVVRYSAQVAGNWTAQTAEAALRLVF
ncbi:autotransporter outer membrane beta-barrel domain-containing protein [Acidocella sp.]|uniref:autotransporter outer membrane beta-barrel domain-containing protein n=1 Tax=Acidocella sp. TaxID=50710 RepID=UPI00262CC69A|nr:autotransporter outer membrane beta-barrel domain-containing protein [Acidocella sp.]MDD2795158.1 hypothetical protein [Acidocella sp.]